ncbi:MliC family protein [Roseovarius sp. Pro17]|uniref:MliC family protein n=1 Tax=Roseovarius sp. Pro17 TaxID=3108175 RepID=UPI002D790D3C|nr:MliC family protein [Roseovarius sp. Pro17]
MRISLLALALFATAGAAAAEANLSIPLKSGTMDSVESATYTCGDGEPFSVQYVNAGANALAIFPIDGEDRIFVNVVSASGAKYASGAHVWWTKSNTATLENEMEEGSIQECQSQDTPPSE